MGGRFKEKAGVQFKKFNDSLPVDYRMAVQDIVGSIAWAGAIHQVGVLSDDELLRLQTALKELKASVEENPKQVLLSDAEDIHSWVEIQLIEKPAIWAKSSIPGAAATTRWRPTSNSGARRPAAICCLPWSIFSSP